MVLIALGWILGALKILFKKALENRKKKKIEKKGKPQPSSSSTSLGQGMAHFPPAAQARASPPFLLVSLIFGPTCQPNHPLPPAVFEQDTFFGRNDPETVGFPSQGGKPSPIKFFPRSRGLLLHPNRNKTRS